MSTRTSSSAEVIGILGLFVGILFVGLKSSGYVDWSLWLVTLPFWVAIMPSVSTAAIVFIYAKIVWLLDKRWELKK